MIRVELEEPLKILVVVLDENHTVLTEIVLLEEHSISLSLLVLGAEHISQDCFAWSWPRSHQRV